MSYDVYFEWSDGKYAGSREARNLCEAVQVLLDEAAAPIEPGVELVRVTISKEAE